jgi:asparagine synthase (glutamine-hydrolysing)
MCGIVGFFRIRPENSDRIASDVADAMINSLWRRGPDGGGQWRSADDTCWLGHRRLAVIDLVTGNQPMSNEDGSLWTVYNGEIYNFKTLRAELLRSGHRFKSVSDTEVLLHGYEEWGGEGLVTRLQGIFAFAIYDMNRRSLFLARDHMGVKPLYWWSDGNVFLFASEIKAILAYPGLAGRRVNTAGVAQFLVTRYVSRPNTLFENIRRFPEASWMEVNSGHRSLPKARVYWDVKYNGQEVQPPFGEAVEQLDELLATTVEMQMISDVPLGAQLSGGVDSSVVVALMEKARRTNGDTAPIKTFSVGFDVEKYSEFSYANLIAERYKTDHQEIRVGFRDFVDELPLLCWLYDEPMGEPSAIPTYFMCRKAKEKVTVMLTGEGADEQFGGYSKYAFEQFAQYLRWIPPGLRKRVLRRMGALLPFKARRVRSILEILGLDSASKRYASWYGAFDTETQKEIMKPELGAGISDQFIKTFDNLLENCDSTDDLNRFFYCDNHSRLVDNLLVKGDRMSMAASIEARVPFLDHKVVEFAAHLPSEYKVRRLRTKIILKKLAEKYAPNDIIYRRKVGFTLPLTEWFVGPLRILLRNLLLSDQCLGRGYWQPDAVRRVLEAHLSGKTDREQGIWVLLTLELWHRLFIDDDGTEAAAGRLTQDLQLLMNRTKN